MKIKNTFLALLAIFTILVFGGCSSVDVSKNSGFSSYIGHELPLQSEAAIERKNSNSGVYYDGIHSKFILIDDDSQNWGLLTKQ